MLGRHRLTRMDSYERVPVLYGWRARRRSRGNRWDWLSSDSDLGCCLIYIVGGIGISFLWTGAWLLFRLLWHAH